ncbi:MAG: hypothetical protein ACYSU0_11435, partial [Planctomycetota bacterium]
FEAAAGGAKQRRMTPPATLAAAAGERDAIAAGADAFVHGPPVRPPPLVGSGLPSLRTIVLLI